MCIRDSPVRVADGNDAVAAARAVAGIRDAHRGGVVGSREGERTARRHERLDLGVRIGRTSRGAGHLLEEATGKDLRLRRSSQEGTGRDERQGYEGNEGSSD